MFVRVGSRPTIYTAILSTPLISPLNTHYLRAALTWSSFQVKREKEAKTQKIEAEKRQAGIDRRQRDRDKARAALNGQGDRFVSDLFFKKLMVASFNM